MGDGALKPLWAQGLLLGVDVCCGVGFSTFGG